MNKIFFSVLAAIFVFGCLFGLERLSFFQLHKPFHEPKAISYINKEDLNIKINAAAKECKQIDSSYVLAIIKVDDNLTIARCGDTFSLWANYYHFHKEEAGKSH